jgi:hypothetical protein
MDIPVSSAYLCSMIARLITMFAILAITAVTTVTSVHAARMSMSSGPDHATHVGAMIHSSDIAEPACDAGQHCGSVDAEMCEFVCTGLAAFLTSPGREAGHAHAPASHDYVPEGIHVGRALGPNERPPKLRLL